MTATDRSTCTTTTFSPTNTLLKISRHTSVITGEIQQFKQDFLQSVSVKDGNLTFRDGLTLTWRKGFFQIGHVHMSKSCWQFDVVPLCIFLCNCQFPWHVVWNCASLWHFVCKQWLMDWHLFDGLRDWKMMRQRRCNKDVTSKQGQWHDVSPSLVQVNLNSWGWKAFSCGLTVNKRILSTNVFSTSLAKTPTRAFQIPKLGQSHNGAFGKCSQNWNKANWKSPMAFHVVCTVPLFLIFWWSSFACSKFLLTWGLWNRACTVRWKIALDSKISKCSPLCCACWFVSQTKCRWNKNSSVWWNHFWDEFVPKIEFQQHKGLHVKFARKLLNLFAESEMQLCVFANEWNAFGCWTPQCSCACQPSNANHLHMEQSALWQRHGMRWMPICNLNEKLICETGTRSEGDQAVNLRHHLRSNNEV